MGILADIFVSDTSEALAYETSQIGDWTSHINRYQPIQLRNLTNLEFSTLWALLENEEWDLDKHDLEVIEFSEDGESWLYKFPEKLINLLSNLDSDSCIPFAEAWAKTDELAMSAWTVSEAQDVLIQLIKASKKAHESKQGLYLSGSV